METCILDIDTKVVCACKRETENTDSVKLNADMLLLCGKHTVP